MSHNVYTNTNKPMAIVGLVVMTVVLSYAATHSEEIVEGTVALAKKGMSKAEELFHRGKKKFHILIRDEKTGRMVDSGETIWR